MKGKIIRAAIITVSDTRTLKDDISGDKLVSLMEGFAEVADRVIISDELSEIRETLAATAYRGDIDLILTTGGTGFSPCDNTPEATRSIIEREAPGLAEAMRRVTSEKTPMSMLSRGICGIKGSCLIVNLPGSPKGVEECFEVIRPVLPHAIRLLSGDNQH